MRKELSKLMADIDKYSDSLELAEALDSISYELDPREAYILKEAAINLSQLWKLISEIKYEQASGKPVYYYDRDKQRELMESVLDKEEPHELDYSVNEFEFTTRTSRLLRLEGINTAKELCRKTQVDLKKIDGLGKKSLNEIVEVVAAHGLSLGMSH